MGTYGEKLMTDYKSETAYGTSKGLFGETDRENGEYHFRSGYTQQVYSNAHFVPVEENTAPPHYYRPPERNDASGEQVKKQRKSEKNKGGWMILLLCFLCALIGGAAGAFLSVGYLNGGLKASAAPEAAAEESTAEEANAYLSMPVPETEPKLSAGDIYSLACEQTVSVSVEIVTIDRYGNQIPSVVSGSGFFISNNGHILTNYHVIENAVLGGFNVTVTTHDGSVFVGRIVGTAEERDLALVKIEKEGTESVVFGNSDEVSVGDEVYAVGNPYGVLEFTMTVGHVSGIGRQIATEETEELYEMFQIDANVYSGNSGGPVYDEAGNVVGIVSAKYSTEGMEGIGFAIPVNDASPIIAELVDKGYVSGKAAIGLKFDERYNTVYSRYYRLPEGAFVSEVAAGSCTEEVGVKAGDILMQIGEYTVKDYSDVPVILRHFAAGETAEIRIFREGAILAATIEFDEAVPFGFDESLPVSAA